MAEPKSEFLRKASRQNFKLNLTCESSNWVFDGGQLTELNAAALVT